MIWTHVFFRYELCATAILIFAFSLWLTIYFRCIQIKCFKYAWRSLFLKINQHFDLGELTQSQALTLGLSGTIGIANIAIVSIAIIFAGPGSILWLLLSAFFGMSLKFCEATLGQKFRLIKNDQLCVGGPMVTMSKLLEQNSHNNKSAFNYFQSKSIKYIATIYSISLLVLIVIFGNIFQINQLVNVFSIQSQFNFFNPDYVPLVVIALLVSLVWNGKYNRLGYFLLRVVPFAFCAYIIFSLVIVLLNLDRLLDILIMIWLDAITWTANGYDNLFIFTIGTLMGLISHESGLGISSIAHASAKTDYPVRQGLIAMLEPFIDTVLICFLTALVLLMAMDSGFLPIGYAALNVKLAFEYFIPWFGPLFNFIMMLMTLSCLVSCYFYVGKLIQYIFNCKLSIYTLTGYCLIMYFGMKLTLVDLLPITILLMPLVILPNLVCILIYAKEIKKDLVVFLTNLDDSFIN